MSDELTPRSSDIIFYSTPAGNIHVEVLFNDETFWLSQKRMAQLFGVEVHTINIIKGFVLLLRIYNLFHSSAVTSRPIISSISRIMNLS